MEIKLANHKGVGFTISLMIIHMSQPFLLVWLRPDRRERLNYVATLFIRLRNAT